MYFRFIADALNDKGLTFHYFGVNGKEFEMRWNETVVKEFIIKKLIKTMFDKDSTTQLTTVNINELIDTVNSYILTKDIYIPFPSIESLIDYENY